MPNHRNLLSPLYLDLDGNPVEKPDNCGLYIKALDGSTVKIDIPEDCFAVQLGEMLQYFSGGLLRATPHCVRACPSSDTTREQFAMFIDCVPEQPLKLPKYSLIILKSFIPHIYLKVYLLLKTVLKILILIVNLL